MTRYLCVLLLSGVMAPVCGAETPTSEKGPTSSEWLDRAQEYAEKAKDNDPWLIWVEIASIHAQAGRLEEARSLGGKADENGGQFRPDPARRFLPIACPATRDLQSPPSNRPAILPSARFRQAATLGPTRCSSGRACVTLSNWPLFSFLL